MWQRTISHASQGGNLAALTRLAELLMSCRPSFSDGARFRDGLDQFAGGRVTMDTCCDIGLCDDALQGTVCVDNGNATHFPLRHPSHRLADLVVLPACDRIVRHRVTGRGFLDSLSVGHDLHDDVSIRDDADQLAARFQFDDRNSSNILTLHELRDPLDRIGRLATYGLTRHDVSTPSHVTSWVT